MRGRLYNAWAALPSKLFTGAVGVGGIVVAVWPDKIRAWANWIMTPEQIRVWGLLALAIFIAYWLILAMLRPKEQAATPPSTVQSTHGNSSPTFSGSFHGPITFNHSPGEEHAPKGSTYTLNNLDALERLLSIPPLASKCPETPIWQAVQYIRLIIGDTNEQDCYPETQRQIRQAAIEGRIEIWGKKEIPPRHLSSPRISSEIWSKIPPEYWRDYRLSSLATGEMWDGHDHTWAEPHITRGILAGVYWSLRVHRWEIEREWPRPRASPIKPKDDAQDEWDYLVSKKNGTGPVRDKPVGEALAYVLIGRWGERFMTAVEQGLARSNDVSQQMRQLAHDGRLRVWGRRTESGIHELIPPDYWIDHQFEWFDLLRGNGTTKQTEPPASDRRYVDLMVSRAEIEEVMPYVRPSD